MRFRKSVKIMPGVRVNLSMSGVSTSLGGRGASVNLSSRGVRSTVSLPGTGLSWSSQRGWSGSSKSSPRDEVELLRVASSKAIDTLRKATEKANASGARVERAIEALNGGRGPSASKLQTFEKRILAEEQKLAEIEESATESTLFLEAIIERLNAIQFGFFSMGKKQARDDVVRSVSKYTDEARRIRRTLELNQNTIGVKLSDAQEAFEKH